MNIIESHWRQRQSLIEDAIYFGNDDFIELDGNPNDGYQAGIRASVATLLQADPDPWDDGLDVYWSVQTNNFEIFAGGTAWEAVGFVALEQRSTGRLLWLLYLNNSEHFIKVSLQGSIVLAISEDAPFQFEWHIPIQSPEKLTVTAIHDA
ncbi:MAG: hypothetical protein LBE21_08945 [Pseudomonadales bacterium]|jgi:hypothetical protein|nr:hypothetical protein [Pseudomonadales bacterium]